MTRPSADGAQPVTAPASLVRNSSWSLGAQAASVALGALVSVVAVRVLTVAEWGYYSTALSLVSLLVVFAELGVATVVLRRLSSEGADASETVGGALGAVGMTGLLAAFALVPVTMALGYPRAVLVVVAPAAALCFLQPLLAVLRAVFTASRVVSNAAVVLISQATVTAAVTLALLGIGVRQVAPMLGLVAGYAAAVTVGMWLLRRRLGVRPARVGMRPATHLLRLAVPLAGVGLIAVVYAQLDVIMLSKLADSAEVAYYTVPYAIVRLTWLAPSLIAGAFFPLLVRLTAEDPDEARRTFLLMVRIFFVISAPVSLFLAVTAPTLLPALFGSAYGGRSAEVLSVMAWTCVLGFQNYLLWSGVLAVHRERHVLVWQLAGLATNLALNLALIPLLGAVGAAISLVVSDLLTVIGQAAIVHRNLVPLPFGRLLVRPVAAGLVLAGPTIALASVSPGLAGVLGGAGYVGFLVLGRYVTPEEWEPLVGPMRSRWART